MNRRYSASVLAGLVLLAGASTAAAGTGAKGVFTIHNATQDNTVTSFYTNDGTGWSSNWLSERLGPGESAKAEFSDETGSCEQTLQVGWLGEDSAEVVDDSFDIDICDASNVYLEDNNITYD